jgi:hypothetical protein
MDFPVDYFTGDGTSTTFQLSFTPASATSILVHIGGVKQVASTTDPAYYLDGSKLVFVSPPGAYSPIEVNYLGIAGQVNIPGTQSVTQSMLSLQLANTFVYQTTANGATASFTLNAPPVSANSLVVSANGVVQYDYSVNGTNLTFGFTPPVGTFIRITSLALAQAGVPSDGSVTSVKLGANLTITGNTTFSGNIFASAGSAGSPSISTTGDTNTGIYFPAADTIAFTEGGVESMRVTNSGGLCVGTTTDPGGGNINIKNDGFYGWGGLDSLIYGTSAASGYIYFRTGGAEKMRIDSSGNVGIGTSSPNEKLGVAGAIASTSNASNFNQAKFLLDYNSGSGRLSSYASGGSTIEFYTNPSAGTATERMRIDSVGNVGIGTSSPDSSNKLQVAGDIGVSWAANEFIGMKFGSGGSYKMGLMLNDTTRECKVWSQSSYSDDKITFYTGSTPSERMRITSGGNITIGSSSVTGDGLVISSPMAKAASSSGWGINVSDTNTDGVAGRGGAIAFSAKRTDGGNFNAGAIAGAKSNSTGMNENGDLVLYSSVSSSLTERMRIDSGGRLFVTTSTAVATGYAPFQISYVNQFTNLGTTPQSVTYSGGNVFIAHFFLRNNLPDADQASFTIYAGRDGGISHKYTGYAGGNCSLSETSEGVFSITSLGDGVTYTLNFGTGSPNATFAASTTLTGTTTLAIMCISSSL